MHMFQQYVYVNVRLIIFAFLFCIVVIYLENLSVTHTVQYGIVEL